MANFCENCGTQIREGAKFCPGCGAAVTAGPPQQTQAPPQPQPPSPQQGYYPPPSPPKKKFPVWLIIVIAAAAVVTVFMIIGITAGNDTEDSDYTEETVQTDEDEFALPEEEEYIEEPTEESDFIYTNTVNENPSTFDFAVLSEADFPRGAWTVNQLTGIYGPPEEAYAFYLSGYEIAFIRVIYERLIINFLPRTVENFSFYSQSLMDGEYALNENDKNLEFEIVSLRSIDVNAVLPNGIKIGQSTKLQVVSAYREDPSYIYNDREYDTDMISYQYTFADASGAVPQNLEFYELGSVSYFFDRNEVLEFVIVEWLYYDL